MNADQDGETQEGQRPAAEWAVGVLGAVVLIAVVGFLAYQAAAVRDGPPNLRVPVIQVDEQGPPYVVTVRVHNGGGRTAEDVQLAGELARGDTTVEQASATARYVPPHSHRKALLVFRTDPDTATLNVKAAGYSLP